MKKHAELFYRVFFSVAIVFLVIAVISWFLRLIGVCITWLEYEPGRYFEFAGITLLFVFAFLLRQIRDALSKEDE